MVDGEEKEKDAMRGVCSTVCHITVTSRDLWQPKYLRESQISDVPNFLLSCYLVIDIRFP